MILCVCLLGLAPSPRLQFPVFTLAVILLARDNTERYHQGQRDHLQLKAPFPLLAPVILLEKGSPRKP